MCVCVNEFQPAVTYDQTKAYYQPTQGVAAAAAAAAVASYTAAETHYQAGKYSFIIDHTIVIVCFC